MPESSENIYQKLAKVKKSVEVLEKNKSGYGYKYVSEDEILARITGIMDKQHLSLIPQIVPGTFKAEPYAYTKVSYSKETKTMVETPVNEIITQADMKFVWINNDDPSEFVVVPWAMVGHQADGSQGYGTALTYAYRYFLLKFFGIATTSDDPDEWRGKQAAAAEEEKQKALTEILDEFDERVRLYLAANPGKTEEVQKFSKKYIKSGKYKEIKNVALASVMQTKGRTFLLFPGLPWAELLETSNSIVVITTCIGGILGKGTERAQDMIDFMEHSKHSRSP